MQPSNPEKSDSVWNYKPWWCQPWSIALTGIGLIAGSWLCLHTIWFTVIVAVPLSIWMVFFLFIYPKAMQQAVQDEQAN
jgi:hypothetical protein